MAAGSLVGSKDDVEGHSAGPHCAAGQFPTDSITGKRPHLQCADDVLTRPTIPSATLLLAAIMGLAGLVYVNALHNPFVYDDFRTILDDGSITSAQPLT